MNLTSYAELAVRLANTAARDLDEPDPLASAEAFRQLVTGSGYLAGPVTTADLAALRLLRDEFGQIFAAAAAGQDAAAIERINALLVRYPVQPELVRHDEQGWHVHLATSGSVADRYGAGAIVAISLLVSQFGVGRLGVCAIASCSRVFLDASSNRSRRYCAHHVASRANVTAIRGPAGEGQPARPATAAS